MIGIVGGIGPLAGVDLYKKIVENTEALVDQDHLPVLLASLPGEISDRTTFLLGGADENPAQGLAKVIRMLEQAGARQIAIACNTAHATPIFQPLLLMLESSGFSAEIINLIDVTIEEIMTHPGKPRRIGVLATSGTYQTRIYQDALEHAGLEPVMLPYERNASLVHEAIYQIKIWGQSVGLPIRTQLNTAARELRSLGAEAVILGCTELGMIENLLDLADLQVFNPNTIMARALIRKHSPHKLSRG